MNEAYPPLTCQFCGVLSDEVVVYCQRTAYVDMESNYVAVCPGCRRRNDEHWDDMWQEYYANLL